MLDLTPRGGLPAKFDPETCCFSLGPDVRAPLYATRELDALRPVLEDPTCTGPEVVYWMYRNTGLRGDEHLLDQHRLRYDISIFVPCTLGREPMKTSGHYHPPLWRGGARCWSRSIGGSGAPWASPPPARSCPATGCWSSWTCAMRCCPSRVGRGWRPSSAAGAP